MCGLVAMIARRGAGFNQQDIKQLENLMIVDSTRGRDSTGMVNIKRDREVNFIKHANEPAVLFQSKYWEEFKKEIYSSGMIDFGHNRAATRGMVSSENAHPFIEDNIVLIHNGTLMTHSNLTKTKVDVDSHAIAHALKENDDIEEVVKKINGAFALIWWDTKKDKLFAIRNSDRPLVLTETPEFYILTSEPWMAWGTSSQVNRKIDSARMLNVGELLSFEVGGKMESAQFDLTKPAYQTTYTGGAGRRHPYACAYGSDYEDATDNENFGSAVQPVGTVDRGQEVGKPQQTTSTESTDSQKTSTVSNAINAIASMESPKTGTTGSKAALLIAKSPLMRDTEEPFVKSMLIGSNDTHKYFKRQNMTEFRVHELSRLNSGRVKFVGKCSEAGMPMADVIGLMPVGFDIVTDGMNSYNTPWYGRIMSVREPMCGLSILVVDIFKAHTIELYSGTVVAMQVWAKIKMTCKCRVCEKPIVEADKYATHVLTPKLTLKDCAYPINTIEVKCADCIEENVPAGELRAKFNQLRAKGIAEVEEVNARKASSVQDRKSIGIESVIGTSKAIVVSDSKTVH